MRARLDLLTPRFVEFIPAEGKDLIPGIVYISMKYNTVVHRCPCGCGGLSEFTLDPIRFRIEYDGKSVTFSPSIGNSNLQCRSHYWIRGNHIQWCTPMKDWETKAAQRRELGRAREERKAIVMDRKTRISRCWTGFVNWWKR